MIRNSLKNTQNFKLFSGFILSFLCGLLIITILQKQVFAKSATLSVTNQGLLTIQADNLELKHIILEFETQHSLVFTGFSDYMDHKTTLFYTGSTMDVVKKLLKLLKIQNSAYTFNEERLIRVTALPSSTSANTIKKSLEPVMETTKKQNTKKLNSTSVLIKKVLPDSQGEMIQLEVNDHIIAYNGHKIPHTRKLIDYVKKYKLEESISIVIVRDERILEFTLRGGLIGVQIITIPMNFEILESYYRDLGFSVGH